MMRVLQLIPLIAALSVTSTVMAGGEYDAALIDGNLLKNADAVKRKEEIRFTIDGLGRTRLFHHYVITILNSNGDLHANFIESYDQLQQIGSIEGNLYDAQGNKLKSLKRSDIQDISAYDGVSLVSDDRIKRHRFNHRIYPYTIEYSFETEFNHTFFMPLWIPVEGYRLAVQQSSFQVTFQSEYELRYKVFNFKNAPLGSQKGKDKMLTWELRNHLAVENEYAMPSLFEVTPSVLLAPTQFKLGKYEGNMQSWLEYGKFMYTLTEGRAELDEATKKKVHELTDGIQDKREKINLLYRYLQNNTHYVGVQLGIGGWQPFEAKYVAGKGYGDCKALSNFMLALLKEAGIPSNYTLINSGANKYFFLPDFPLNRFNHAILSVPLENDTVWLECTSQITPAGYMGSFTGNRWALAVNENGGTLVRTPAYKMEDNLQVRHVKAVLDEEANLQLKCVSRYTGLQQEDLFQFVRMSSKEDLLKYLQHKGMDLPHYEVNSFNYKEVTGKVPELREELEISSNNYASMTGKRLFIVPNIISRHYARLMPDSTRRYPLEFQLEYRDIDTVEIELPLGYVPELMPKETAVQSKFGKYKSACKLEGNRIIYTRLMEHNSGRFAPEDYAALVDFYQQIYKADRNRMVLVKN